MSACPGSFPAIFWDLSIPVQLHHDHHRKPSFKPEEVPAREPGFPSDDAAIVSQAAGVGTKIGLLPAKSLAQQEVYFPTSKVVPVEARPAFLEEVSPGLPCQLTPLAEEEEITAAGL